MFFTHFYDSFEKEEVKGLGVYFNIFKIKSQSQLGGFLSYLNILINKTKEGCNIHLINRFFIDNTIYNKKLL